MNNSEINFLLVFGIAVCLGLLVVLMVIRRVRERQKKSAELIFGEPVKKEKIKSPNAIVGILNKVSKILFKIKLLEKILPYPKGIAEKKLENDLMLASRPFDLDVRGVTQLKFFCGLVFFILLFIVAANNPNSQNFYYYAVIFGVIGFFYPNLFITNILQVRKQKISRLIPDAMDFISLCLAAGMNFQLAVEEYIKRNNNVLADEFSIFSNEMQVGISRVDGFQHMLERNESPELKNFLSSVIQSERLGTPLRPVIANQAIELRGKRKQMVEKAIASAPVKMLFPLILFILPAMLMIILGSVLLPASKTSGVIFTTNDFYFYQVTPQVKVTVNSAEYPLMRVTKSIDPNTRQISVFSEKGNITSYTQQEFLAAFFKEHSDLEEAWFIRIDLPENALNLYKIDIISNTKPPAVKTKRLLIHYLKFELEGYKGERFQQSSPTMMFRGQISSGIDLKITNNEKPVSLKNLNKQTGDFETSLFKLSSGRNNLSFQLTLKTGLIHTIIKTVDYTGVDISASFAEPSPTLKDSVKLVGLATPGSHVIIRKFNYATGKFDVVTEFDIAEKRDFEVYLTLSMNDNKGDNTFRLSAELGGSKSPDFQLSITRGLSE
jgi:tight adherence protein C